MIKKSKDFFDAVVIGAGPSGCEIAYRLAKKGFKVIVLEKENLNREKPCGGGIQLQEILEFGIPKKAIERKIRRARVVFPDNRQIESRISGKKPASRFAATVKRSIYDRFLQERARKAGAVIVGNAEVLKIRKKTLKAKEGKKKRMWFIYYNRNSPLKTKLIINASGFNNKVSSIIGIKTKNAKEREIATTYHVWLKIPKNKIKRYFRDAIEFYFLKKLPEGYAWIFPKKDFVDVGIGGLNSKIKERNINLKKELYNFINKHPIASVKLRNGKIIRKEIGIMPLGILPRLYSFDCSMGAVNVGDAGGFANIIHGGGIYHARKSAEIASECCIKFLKTGKQLHLEEYGDAARRSFENNEQKWDRKLRNILWNHTIVNEISPYAEKDKDLRNAILAILTSADSHEKAYKIVEKKVLEIIYRQLDKSTEKYKGVVNNRLKNIFTGKSRPEMYANEVLLNNRAKRLRAALGIIAAQMFKRPKKSIVFMNDAYMSDAINFSLVYELFHTASLVHDDIIDEAHERRGKKTINAKYGINNAIITGDIMLAKSYSLVSKFLNNKRISKKQATKLLNIIGEAGVKCCIGESMDVEMAKKKEYDSIKKYIKMVELKTGSLIEGCVKGGAAGAGASERHIKIIGEFGKNLGIAFQIIDDSLDLLGGKKAQKTIMNDIKQGKPTPMLIYALKRANKKERKKILSIVGSKNINKNISKKEMQKNAEPILNIYRKYDAIEYAQKLSKIYVERARRYLSMLPKGKAQGEFGRILDVLEYWSLLSE